MVPGKYVQNRQIKLSECHHVDMKTGLNENLCWLKIGKQASIDGGAQLLTKASPWSNNMLTDKGDLNITCTMSMTEKLVI